MVWEEQQVGLDKIEQNGQPEVTSNSARKVGCQLCRESKMATSEDVSAEIDVIA